MFKAMFGFGTKMNQVFRSRWKAVTWSLGILLTAYCTVPVVDQARQHETAKAEHAKAAHKSAWAKD
ncbi:MAG: hypothetical protein ABL912_07675 [Novosphingobium sp.]